MLVYLGYLAVVAWIVPLAARRRITVTAVVAASGAAIWALADSPGPYAAMVRAWAPGVDILIGYWLSGAFFRAPMPGVERWLRRSDDWFFDRIGLAWFAERGPRWLLEVLECAYASVTLLLPAGFLVVLLLAPTDRTDRYWAPVVAAELACYAMLPWLQTRTPRALRDHVAIEQRPLAFRRLNLRMLRHASIEVNTLPSGHVAGAFGVAFAVLAQVPLAGPFFLLAALAISVGTVVGRYHYAIDALLGLAVAVIAYLVVGR